MVASKPKKHRAPFARWREPLRAIRRKHGLTQVAAAEKLGVSPATWIAWENNIQPPSRAAARLIQFIFPD